MLKIPSYYIIPCMLILLFEFRKRSFLKKANKENHQFENINIRHLNIKVIFFHLFIILFIFYHYFFHENILQQMSYSYRTMYNSSAFTLFVVVLNIIGSFIKDFYIENNIVVFPFARKEELYGNVSYVVIKKNKVYTKINLIITTQNSKKRKYKLNIYNNKIDSFNLDSILNWEGLDKKRE